MKAPETVRGVPLSLYATKAVAFPELSPRIPAFVDLTGGFYLPYAYALAANYAQAGDLTGTSEALKVRGLRRLGRYLDEGLLTREQLLVLAEESRAVRLVIFALVAEDIRAGRG